MITMDEVDDVDDDDDDDDETCLPQMGDEDINR